MTKADLTAYVYTFDTLTSVPPLSTHSVWEEVQLKNDLLKKGWILGPAKTPKDRTAGLYRPKNWFEKLSDYFSKSH
jgi:hypothetical protein